VYMYYGLTNFYQNHRRYVKSRDDYQLLGHLDAEPSSDCAPFDINDRKEPIAPCGAIANSLFSGVLFISVYCFLLSYLQKLNFSSTSYWKELFCVTRVVYLKVLNFRFKKESLKDDVHQDKSERQCTVMCTHQIDIITFWIQHTEW
jgi:hypothetical protein